MNREIIPVRKKRVRQCPLYTVITADTLICNVKMLAALAWLKQIDFTGHWLVQHTAPVRAMSDSSTMSRRGAL